MYGNQRGLPRRRRRHSPLDHDALDHDQLRPATALAGGVTLAAPQYPLSFTPLVQRDARSPRHPADGRRRRSMTDFPSPAHRLQRLAWSAPAGRSPTPERHSAVRVRHLPRRHRLRPWQPAEPGAPRHKAAGAQHGRLGRARTTPATTFPVGTNYPGTGPAAQRRVPLPDGRRRELHEGRPELTLLNPPGGSARSATRPARRRSTTTAATTRSGRAARTSAPRASALCGINPPTPDHSDPETGYVSTSTQRAFGQDTGGNTNVVCTGSFGDVKGLDTWVFYPSTTLLAPLSASWAPRGSRARRPTRTTARRRSTPRSW